MASVIDTAVRRLNVVLAMLNFRRRPIYLSDDELAMDPRFIATPSPRDAGPKSAKCGATSWDALFIPRPSGGRHR